MVKRRGFFSVSEKMVVFDQQGWAEFEAGGCEKSFAEVCTIGSGVLEKGDIIMCSPKGGDLIKAVYKHEALVYEAKEALQVSEETIQKLRGSERSVKARLKEMNASLDCRLSVLCLSGTELYLEGGSVDTFENICEGKVYHVLTDVENKLQQKERAYITQMERVLQGSALMNRKGRKLQWVELLQTECEMWDGNFWGMESQLLKVELQFHLAALPFSTHMHTFSYAKILVFRDGEDFGDLSQYVVTEENETCVLEGFEDSGRPFKLRLIDATAAKRFLSLFRYLQLTVPNFRTSSYHKALQVAAETVPELDAATRHIQDEFQDFRGFFGVPRNRLALCLADQDLVLEGDAKVVSVLNAINAEEHSQQLSTNDEEKQKQINVEGARRPTFLFEFYLIIKEQREQE